MANLLDFEVQQNAVRQLNSSFSQALLVEE